MLKLRHLLSFGLNWVTLKACVLEALTFVVDLIVSTAAKRRVTGLRHQARRLQTILR